MILTFIIFLAYTFIHFTADAIFLYLIPKKYARLSHDDQINLSEKICSSLNAILMTCFGIYLCLLTPSFDHCFDAFHNYPKLLEIAYPFYLGYTFYDMTVMYFQTQHWTMWLHHWMGAFGAIIMILFKKAALFSTFFMMTEVTAFIDNIMWYIKMLYLPDIGPMRQKYLKFRVLPFIRAWIFLTTRIWVGPFIIYKGINVCGGIIPMLYEWTKIPFIVSLTGISITLLLTTLNFIWTFVIVGKSMNYEDKLI